MATATETVAASLPADKPSSDVSEVYHTVYSPTFLGRIYDWYVLGFNMRYMWGCPTDSILQPFFNENFSRRHLDVGVATGYFPAVALSQPWRKDSKQELMLVDITANSLNVAKARCLAVAPAAEIKCVEADVTEPLPEGLKGQKFDSISMFNLFHCVPGTEKKLTAFATYKDLLAEKGVLTGCTVLGIDEAMNFVSRAYVTLYNNKGIFNNADDKKERFIKALEENFEEVETWVFGMTLMFRATKPKY